MSVHDQVHAFADGELAVEEAEKFRDHLADCAKCQEELQEILQLQALSWKPPEGGNVVSLVWWKRKRTLTVASTVVAMAAGFALFLRLPGGEDFGLGATRHLEARVSDGRADHYRPYDVERGGTPKERPNLKLLAKLEEKSDWRALADAWLLAGDADQAAAYLDKLGDSPEADNDRAVFYFERGDFESAITFADRALRARPQMTQALWNRALAERDLGLPRVAAKSFGEVAAKSEPGWADEATKRQKALADEAAAEMARASALDEAGKKMLEGGAPIPLEMARAGHGRARHFLYDAIRSAQTQARAQELLPLAEAVDALDHGDELAKLAKSVAAADWKVRAPLAAAYQALATGKGPTDEAAQKALIARFEAGHQNDLALGALQITNFAFDRVEDFRKLAGSDRDLLAMSAYYGAAELAGKNQTAAAVALLQKSIADCDHGGVQLRCANNENLLAINLIAMHRVAEARGAVVSAWTRARGAGDEGLRNEILDQLGELHLLANRFGLVRAYLTENALRQPDNAAAKKHAYETIALSFVAELKPAEAHAQIAEVKKLGRPLDGNGVWALADLSHQGISGAERTLGLEGVANLKSLPGLTASDRVLYDAFEGRLVFDADPRRGRQILEKVIDDANHLPREEADAQKGRALAYQTLIGAAAQANEFSRAYNLLVQESRVTAPISV
jgi:hypothetical protein